MTHYNKTKHDIGLENPDNSDVIGMMLVQDKEVPQYAEFDDEYLASQFFTGTPGYGSLPAEKELAMRQDDWRSGFGQEIFDPDEPKRYHTSVGMDLRFKGRAIAGPISTAATKPSPSAPSITNADMELDANWTQEVATTERSAAEAHGGTYSWLCHANGSIAKAYQDMSTFLPGATYTFTCYNLKLNNCQSKIVINDGVSDYESAAAQNATWTQMSVQATISTAATRLRLELWGNSNAGAGGDYGGYFDDAAISITPPTIGVPACKAEFNDELYVAFGTVLAKQNAGGTGFDAVAIMPATITDLEVFGDNLFIALGTADEYFYMSTAEAFTESNAAVKMFNFFKSVNAATPVMWGSDGDNTIRSNTNPINGGAAWSAQTTIDSSFNEITNLLTTGGDLYVFKEDLPYYLDSGTVQNDLAQELGSLTKSTDNGKNADVWLNKIYIPWGDQSLLECDSGTNTWRNPADFAVDLSDFNGQVMAVTHDDRYLFAVLDNSTKLEILAGREEVIDGSTVWVWHPFHEMTLTGCETAFVSSVYQKRLWICSTSSSDDIYYIPLFTGYADVTGDSNRTFLTDTYFTTPKLHANFKDTDKAYIKVDVLLGHTYDADIYFECWYKKLEDSDWTDAGDLKGTTNSRRATLYIPADDGGVEPVSTMMEFKFVAKTDSTTTTPELLSYKITGILYPDERKIIACTVRCADNIITKQGTDNAVSDTIKSCIDNARNNHWPIKFYDPDGNERYVKILSTGSSQPRWSIFKKILGKYERHYNLLLQEVTLE